MTLDLMVYDREFNLQGFVENYRTLLWTRSYFTPGSFRLECPIIDRNIKMMQLGNILRKKDIADDGSSRDADEAGVIEYVYKVDNRSVKYIVAEGRFLSSYLDRRIVKWTKTHKGASGSVMQAFINDCVSIPMLAVGDVSAGADAIDKQATWKNLLTVIEDIALTSVHGFRVRPDFVNRRMIFEVYDGLDRSTSQHDRNQVIFSDDYSNLNECTHEHSDLLYKNYFYIGGQGDGSDRRVVEMGDKSASGLDLREMFVDARDIMQEEEMTQSQYDNLLLQRGRSKQAECVVSDSIEPVVIPTMNFTYKKDYDLGDVVTVEKASWGIKANLRITSLMEQYAGSTFTIFPTFGDPIPKQTGGNANEW